MWSMDAPPSPAPSSQVAKTSLSLSPFLVPSPTHPLPAMQDVDIGVAMAGAFQAQRPIAWLWAPAVALVALQVRCMRGFGEEAWVNAIWI